MANAHLPTRYSTSSAVGASLNAAGPVLAPGVPGQDAREILYEGWVLKKRRKRMQGFARRYFTLYSSGVLAYSFEPGQPTRDSLVVTQAAISTALGRKDIHVDSSTATFHIRCLSTDDFNAWMGALRKFIIPEGGRKSAASIRGTLRAAGQVNKSGVLAEEMGSTITELEEAIVALQVEEPPKRQRSKSRSKPDKEKPHKEPVFGLFKKSSSYHGEIERGRDTKSDHRSSTGSRMTLSASQQRVQAALTALKAQHAALLKSLQALHVESNLSTTHNSPLPSTAEEDEYEHRREHSSRSSITRLSRNLGRIPPETRSSLASAISDGTLNEWFDAPDGEEEGAEEFVMDASPEDEQDGTSRITRTESPSSSQDQEFDTSADTDSEDEEAALQTTLSLDTGLADSNEPAGEVARRTQLPAGPTSDEGSLFAVLKKNVGKDLSTIAFPVTFNEPLTLLQRAAEEVEYYEVLREAVTAADPIERLCFVAAFAVSGYAHTRHRSSRKGFNPMLAETFEDSRMKFLAEKVVHNPVVMAYHAEGPGWELNATSSGKTKFWGKSLEIIPLGVTRLTIGNDVFEWRKPSSFMRNLMVGTKYLEHCGKMVIDNTTTGASCVLEFKQSGYWGASNIVSGHVLSPSGQTISQLEGKWDDQMAQVLDSSYLKVLWRMRPFPPNSEMFYGWTSYGLTLNEITPDMQGKLPPTDSRYRPDVRALEEGDLDTAEAEKTRVEELQRERRRAGRDRAPMWFKQVGDEWIYKGGYWEQRAKGWKDVQIEPLW
ncbi:hypothetical protein PLICRDRAFT_151971 [Plicaturopsis crispa FD-325 SS-3]|nr:hypothetical protein PLICRDRAFT_151971 [Plicaturopsis crispa FD-325 SS-3]